MKNKDFANKNENVFFDLMQKNFGQAAVFKTIYKNNEEFADCLVKIKCSDINHILIFQLKHKEDYKKSKKSSKPRWNLVLEGSLKKAREQIKKNIEHVAKNGTIFNEANINQEINPINETCVYHYFIILYGYAEFQNEIYKEKGARESEGGEGGVILITTGVKRMYKNFISSYQGNYKPDLEFMLEINKCIFKTEVEACNGITIKEHFVHVLDEESWNYASISRQNTSIFTDCFENNYTKYFEYLKKKEIWLLEKQEMLIEISDERSLISFYLLNGSKLPQSGNDIKNLFYSLEGFIKFIHLNLMQNKNKEKKEVDKKFAEKILKIALNLIELKDRRDVKILWERIVAGMYIEQTLHFDTALEPYYWILRELDLLQHFIACKNGKEEDIKKLTEYLSS
jgi:hypothetical protein